MTEINTLISSVSSSLRDPNNMVAMKMAYYVIEPHAYIGSWQIVLVHAFNHFLLNFALTNIVVQSTKLISRQ